MNNKMFPTRNKHIEWLSKAAYENKFQNILE